MALGAVDHRGLMDAVATAAGNVAEMRGVRIRLIGRGLGGEILVGAVTFAADGRIRLLRRRIFGVARGAVEAGRDVLVDQIAVS